MLLDREGQSETDDWLVVPRQNMAADEPVHSAVAIVEGMDVAKQVMEDSRPDEGLDGIVV